MKHLIILFILVTALFTNYNIYLLTQICTEIQYRITAIGDMPSEDNRNKLDQEED